MMAASHSKRDTTRLYTISDQDRVREHVKLIWDRVAAAGGTQ
jgi:hypothetical protein